VGFHYTQLYYLTPYLYRTNQVLYVLKDVKEKFVHQNVKTFAKENTSLLAIKKNDFRLIFYLEDYFVFGLYLFEHSNNVLLNWEAFFYA